jgi:hypothetical protein
MVRVTHEEYTLKFSLFSGRKKAPRAPSHGSSILEHLGH